MNFIVRMFVKNAVIDASLIVCEVCDVNYGASSQAGSLLAEVSLCLVVRDSARRGRQRPLLAGN